MLKLPLTSYLYTFIRLLAILLLGWVTVVSSWAQVSTNACVRGADVHIVILGSPTAAGTGPSNRDSTWVNRYRTHLQQLNPNNRVTNLARGGTTTYHIMPDSFVAPSGHPSTDSIRNVSQALRLQPDAIIIIMPSNDARLGFIPPEQLQNFRLIVQVANDQGVPVWVCTTQPRFFADSIRIATQVTVRDSIFQIFGPRTLDFWSGFADSSNYIRPIYDSGDGVHMNDAAHSILMQRVQQADLLGHLTDTLPTTDWVALELYTAPTSICGTATLGVYAVVGNAGQASLVTPNVHIAVRTGGNTVRRQ